MEQNLKSVIEESFIQYSGAVLQNRALIDVRDGLKPSARQILYCMYKNKYLSTKPFQPTPAPVGDAIKSFYKHGDASCLGIIMRAAQPFAMRYPLVEVKCNSGTLIASGNWAASRYTKSRLSPLGELIFHDIDKDIIQEWREGIDETQQYPAVTPSKGFYSLCNGVMGIGIGMASSVPQYNLKELNEALCKLLLNPEIDFEEIYCAPDFATGAILLNANEVKESHKNGHGFACKLRSKVDYDSKERCFIVSEIPYMVYTETICKELEEIIESDKNPGIDRFNDLTGATPNIKIYLARNANPDRVLKELYKNTSLQSYYSINFTMLESGRFPRVFTWKELLQAHIDHEKEVYRRGFEFDLKKIQNRLHIIEGLLKAYDVIDEVIQTIKTAADTKSANIALQKLLQIDEAQAKAILDLKLSKLSKLDIGKLKSEQDELTQRADQILEILNNADLFNNELIKGWREVAEKFGDPRRTRILSLSEDNNETIEIKSLMVNLTNENNLFIEETSSLYSQRRGGVGSKFKLGKSEYVITSTTCQNTDNLLFFTQKGNVYAYEAGALPIGEKIAIESLFLVSTNERVCAITNLSKNNPAQHIVFITKNGILKKSLLSEYNIKRAKNGIKALELNPNDEVNSILFMNEEKLGIATKSGNFIIIETKDIRPIGRTAKGIIGIKLDDSDYVVSARAIGPDTKEIISISEDGYIKRTSISEFRVTGRGTKGVKLQKTDVLCDFLPVAGALDVLITAETSQIRLRLTEIPQLSRGTQGVRAIKLPENSKIKEIEKIQLVKI